MTDAPNPQKSRSWGWGRIALILSLAVNLIVIGLVAGVLLSPPNKGPKGARHLDRVSMGLGSYVMALPEDARAQVIAAAGGLERGSRKEAIKKFREGRRKVVQLINDPNLDSAALEAALEEQRGFAMGRTVALHTAFVEAVTSLSSEERAAFLERAKELRKRHRRNRLKN